MKFAILENLVRFWENLQAKFVEKEDGKGLSTNDFTDVLKTEYDTASDHSKASHAPANAQPNVIEGITVNDEAVTVTGKVADITIPTKIGDLEDIEGLDMDHPEIDVDDDTEDSDDLDYGGTFDIVDDVTRDDLGHVLEINTKKVTLPDKYEHPESTIDPDTYTSVTVDEDGHGTAGTNPTTRDGLGLTDVPTITEMNSIITTTVTTSGKIQRKIVTVLPDPGDGEVNTIYFILRDTPDGADNIYDEWMLINDEWEKMGDTMSSIENLVVKSGMEEATEDDIDLLVMNDSTLATLIANALTFDVIAGDNLSEDAIIYDLATLPVLGNQIDGFGGIHQEVFIDWQSTDITVVDPVTGTVYRPSFTNGDEEVTLTATVICGEFSEEVVFVLTVKFTPPTDAEAVAVTKSELTFDDIKLLNTAQDNILTNLTLPSSGFGGTSITWESNKPGVINPTNGVVTRPAWVDGDSDVTLTATISRDDDE